MEPVTLAIVVLASFFVASRLQSIYVVLKEIRDQLARLEPRASTDQDQIGST